MSRTNLNSMLQARLKELARRKHALTRDEWRERRDADLPMLRRCLGLEPLPPRTPLEASTTGVLRFDGYRLEKVAFASRPGVVATAHLYLPEGEGPFPAVVNAHGDWPFKKQEPVEQARGVSFALAGFAALHVDAPGILPGQEDPLATERLGMGDRTDPLLGFGAPAVGVYTWDLIRALDLFASRPDLDSERIGITGAGWGGVAASYAFVLEERFRAGAFAGAAGSLEEDPDAAPSVARVPGLARVGDRSDVLAMRAPAPLLLMANSEDPGQSVRAHERTLHKLQHAYRLHRSEGAVRLEAFEGRPDYSRRMREVALAFFAEHLQGGPRRSYLPEARPLTDGRNNPHAAGTLDPASRELRVLEREEETTFRQLIERALREPYPAPFDLEERLVRWGRYGRLASLRAGAELHLADDGEASEDRYVLPWVDRTMCHDLGLSVPEFHAQVLHLLLPGRPDNWEPVAMGGDPFTSMIASMKTLLASTEAEEPPSAVVAEGPVASMTAHFFARLRGEVEVRTSHSWSGWSDVAEAGHPDLVQPGARYLAWPFNGGDALGGAPRTEPS